MVEQKKIQKILFLFCLCKPLRKVFLCNFSNAYITSEIKLNKSSTLWLTAWRQQFRKFVKFSSIYLSCKMIKLCFAYMQDMLQLQLTLTCMTVCKLKTYCNFLVQIKVNVSLVTSLETIVLCNCTLITIKRCDCYNQFLIITLQ